MDRGASSAAARPWTISYRWKRSDDWTLDRLRGPRSKRQADAGRALARLRQDAGAQGAAGLVSGLRHLDRRRDRTRAVERARLRSRRDAAALRRQPLRKEG